MHSRPGERVIRLVALEKSFAMVDAPPKVVLNPTTFAMPADRRLAVLGGRGQGKTVFLKLLAGMEMPTRGDVVSSVSLSPIVRFGGLFHPRLSDIENIRFYARMLDLDEDALAMTLDTACNANGAMVRSLSATGKTDRKAAEMALLSVLPFDCYLLDEVAQLEEVVRNRLLGIAAQRGAGIIFSTNLPQLARRYADCAIVIRNGFVHPFSDIEEALAFHER